MNAASILMELETQVRLGVYGFYPKLSCLKMPLVYESFSLDDLVVEGEDIHFRPSQPPRTPELWWVSWGELPPECQTPTWRHGMRPCLEALNGVACIPDQDAGAFALHLKGDVVGGVLYSLIEDEGGWVLRVWAKTTPRLDEHGDPCDGLPDLFSGGMHTTLVPFPVGESVLLRAKYPGTFVVNRMTFGAFAHLCAVNAGFRAASSQESTP